MAYARSTILRSFIWKLLEKFSLQFIAFVVAIVLARLVAPEDFGLVAIIIVIMTISDVIIQGGLNRAVVQKKNPDSSDYSTIFWFSLGVSVLLYALVWIFSDSIGGFFHQEGLKWPLRVLCLTLIFYAFNSVQRAYVSKNMLYRQQFIAAIIAVLLSGGTGIFLAIKGYGVWALVWYYLLSSALTSIFMLITVSWRPRVVFNSQSFKPLFSFGWKVMLSNTIISFGSFPIEIMLFRIDDAHRMFYSPSNFIKFSALDLHIINQVRRHTHLNTLIKTVTLFI